MKKLDKEDISSFDIKNFFIEIKRSNGEKVSYPRNVENLDRLYYYYEKVYDEFSNKRKSIDSLIQFGFSFSAAALIVGFASLAIGRIFTDISILTGFSFLVPGAVSFSIAKHFSRKQEVKIQELDKKIEKMDMLLDMIDNEIEFAKNEVSTSKNSNSTNDSIKYNYEKSGAKIYGDEYDGGSRFNENRRI